MSSEQDIATARTEELPWPPGAPDPDPLAKITLSPRGFAALLAGVGLLVGLILALVPVHVAGPDPARPASITCGNTIGGVETDIVGGGLDQQSPQGQRDPGITVSYVDMCERAIADRTFYAWPMFFAGGLTIIWLGAVRQRPRYLT